MTKKTALVVAPGRGTYNKEELGYLSRFHGANVELIDAFDEIRSQQGQDPISRLDGAEKYSLSKYSRGDNASGLIYACAYADFYSISRESFDIVAVTGNSMGWYIALACAGALSPVDGFRLVNTMGTYMHETLIGGQVLYPFIDDEWRPHAQKRQALFNLIDETPNLHLSIDLGGMIVFGGDAEALEAVEGALEPVGGRFPMRLANHAAFHTPLQKPVSAMGKDALPANMFRQPTVPLVDGRGHSWFPGDNEVTSLWEYTLGPQVTEPYNFTAAIQNGVREFAPDVVIILGPGSTLGGAVAQSLIAHGWRGLGSKSDFIERQKNDPLILSMGLTDQRALAIGELY